MYYDEITRKDFYTAIKEISNNQDLLSDKIDSQLKILNDNNDSNIDCLNNTMKSLHITLLELLSETKKTNICLSKLIKTSESDKFQKFDIEKQKNTSFIVINKSYITAKNYAETLATSTDKKLTLVETMKELSGLTDKYFNVNDYVFVNYNALDKDAKYIISKVILENVIELKVNERVMTFDLKPLNYIIYSNELELIDPKLIEELDIVEW